MSKKLKVLVIHNSYRKTFIGGEDVVFNQEVLALKEKLGSENVFTYEKNNENAGFFQVLSSIFFSFSSYKDIKKLISKYSINIIHVHNFFPLISPSVFLVAKNCHIRSVLTLHNFRPWCIAGTLYREGFGTCELCTKKTLPLSGILNKCFRKSYAQSLLAQFAFSFYKMMNALDWIDSFFVLSEFQKQKLIDIGIDKRKIQIKSNFVKKPLLSRGEPKDYTFIGRPEEGKGLASLLGVWEKLDQSFQLNVIGEMGNSNLIEKYKEKKNILFHGKLQSKRVNEILSKSKYLIHPSLYYETFGLTIVEAFSHGVPVIGFNIGTRRELIKNEVNGFLCEKEQLTDVIKKSLNYSRYDELTRGAMDSYQEFTEDKMTNTAIEIYQNMISDSHEN